MKKLITTLAIVLFVSSTPAASCEPSCPEPEPCPVCEECKPCQPCEPKYVFVNRYVDCVPADCWKHEVVDLTWSLNYVADGDYYGGWDFFCEYFFPWEDVLVEAKLRSLWHHVNGRAFKLLSDDWDKTEISYDELNEALRNRKELDILVWGCEEPQND